MATKANETVSQKGGGDEIMLKEESVKLAVVTAVLMLAVTMFFKNIVHKPQDVLSLSAIPLFLYVGYLTGKYGAKVWVGTMLFLTLATVVLYAFF